MNRRHFITGAALFIPSLLIPRRCLDQFNAYCKAHDQPDLDWDPRIPVRGKAFDAFWVKAPTPIVTINGVDVTNRCQSYDRVAGTAECFVVDEMDAKGRLVFVIRHDASGPLTETIHGTVHVRFA